MSREDWLIERVHLGEATAAEEKEVRSDPLLTARLAALSDADSAFHQTYPATEQLAAIGRKVHLATARERWQKRALGGAGLLIPLAAAAAVLFMQPTWLGGDPDNPMEDRAKGLHPQLVVHLHSEQGPDEALAAGSVVTAGDVLQLGYVPAEATHGVVVSIDGSGAVSLHHPASVVESTALKTDSGEVALPHGYQLDDAPTFERFFFVTDDAPISVRAVLDAAEAHAARKDVQQAPLALEGLQQTSVLLRKAAR